MIPLHCLLFLKECIFTLVVILSMRSHVREEKLCSEHFGDRKKFKDKECIKHLYINFVFPASAIDLHCLHCPCLRL